MDSTNSSHETVSIPTIRLEWSEWTRWEVLELDARSGAGVSPPVKPGVYEARCVESEERLTIGRTQSLRMRVKQGLVKGKVGHPAGNRIRGTTDAPSEDTSRIVVRWAITDRPAAVEEELHRRYRQRFGKLPKYTFFT